MRNIKTVGFVIKPHAPEAEKALNELIQYFEKRNISCLLEKAAAEIIGLENGLKRDDIPSHVDLVIVLGGDGTLLTIAHLAAQEKIPVMGVNLGSLGFLTEVPLNEVFLTLDAFLEGNTKIVTQRRLLDVFYRREAFHCLNDVVINKGALARMIQAKIWIDDKEIGTTRADGLIVSTPTGSTAYSLSAGGPIIQPYVPAIIITPICPHTLSFRPMVIASGSTIRVQLIAGEEVYLTLDGQRGYQMEIEDIIEVCTSSLEFTLVSSPRRNYFDLLQEKLSWG